jgi:hypothetical protein
MKMIVKMTIIMVTATVTILYLYTYGLNSLIAKYRGTAEARSRQEKSSRRNRSKYCK